MGITEKSKIIRCMVTAVLIAEYQLISLVDGTDMDLKIRVKNAIASCRRVQQFFLDNPRTTPEVKELFRQQFMSGEVVLLTELVELCFGMDEQSLEDIIFQIKTAKEE